MNKTVFEEGLEKGMEEGREEGMEMGMEKGMAKGLQNTLLRQGRNRFGPVSDEIEERVRSIQDLGRLESLTDRILEIHSWDELLSD